MADEYPVEVYDANYLKYISLRALELHEEYRLMISAVKQPDKNLVEADQESSGGVAGVDSLDP